jgi:hypothetical protein
MIDEDLEGVLKVRRVADQQPVQTFRPHGPHEAFRDPVRLRSLHWRPNHTHALGLKHGIEATRELAIAIANQKSNRLHPLKESPRDLPRLLRDPGLVGTAVQPARWTRRLPSSMKNSTYTRWSHTVST